MSFLLDKIEEIIKACTVVDSVIECRLTKRKGANKLRLTLEDIVKTVLDPKHILPEFYATDLSRLPPVDITHCDMSAILLEVQGLRMEVRAIRNMQEEIQQLRQQMVSVTDLHNEVKMLKKQLGSIAQCSQGNDNTPSLNSTIPDTLKASPMASSSGMSFASFANDLQVTGMVNKPNLKKAIKPVVGKSTANPRLRSVNTVPQKRTVDIFISRLHPATCPEDIQHCIADILPDISIDDLLCTRLQSKYESLYTSYYVAVQVNAGDMKAALDKLMSAEEWPEGVLIRRYFKPKHGQ